MSNQWHYSQDGAQYGPVDEAEIVRLIQDGELAPGTPVLKEGSNDWQPARSHACFQVEIFPKKMRESVQAAAQNPLDEEKYYEQVAAELQGDNRKQGLWLMAKTKAGSDAEKATSLYTEWRVKQLLEEEARLLSEGKKAPVKATATPLAPVIDLLGSDSEPVQSPTIWKVCISLLIPGLGSLLIRGWKARGTAFLKLNLAILASFLFFGPLWGEFLFTGSDYREKGIWPFLATCLVVLIISVALAYGDRELVKEMAKKNPKLLKKK